ncbi:TetR/AcrR family transcriptional regulator [Streptomyces sp. NPDC001889]
MTSTEPTQAAPAAPASPPVPARTPRPGGGLRERKRRETHRLLATTALRLVAERGLDRVTVEDISAAAGVSPRTFFNYFGSKEDALLLPYPDHAERSAEALERIATAPPSLGPLHICAWAWRRDFESVDADREEWVTRLTVLTDHVALVSRLVALEADEERRNIDALARRLGLAPDDHYPSLVYCVAEGAIRSCFTHWQRIGGSRPLVGLIDHAIDAVAGGLPAHPAGTARPVPPGPYPAPRRTPEEK